MTKRSLTILMVFDAVGGVLFAVWIWRDSLPFRDFGYVDPGAGMVVAMAMALVWGLVVGFVQARTAALGKLFGVLVGGLAGAVLAWPVGVMTIVLAQLTLIWPVPGGGEPVRPSSGDVLGGVLYWLAFVVGAIGVLVLHMGRQKSAQSAEVRLGVRAE